MNKSSIIDESHKSPTSFTTPVKKPNKGFCVSPSMQSNCLPKLKSIVEDVDRGLVDGPTPKKTSHGSSGAYFVYGSSSDKPQAVFKPADEEASMRKGIRRGEECLREVAAFNLDHDGFCGVLSTTLVESNHYHFPRVDKEISSPIVRARLSATASSKSKIGSLQTYFDSREVVCDVGMGILNTDDAQAIAALDIRILNDDRHEGNILIKWNTHGSAAMVPIDHGCSLRDIADAGYVDLVWFYWDEIKTPVTPRTFNYIMNLNIMADIEVLKDLGISGMAVNYFYASSSLLEEGVSAGLSLHDIAVCCYRNIDIYLEPKDPSPLEVIVFRALELLTSLLKTDGRCYFAASHAILGAIVQASNAPQPPRAGDLCELTSTRMSKLLISTSESPDLTVWACVIADRVLSMEYKSFDVSIIEDVDEDLVRLHYAEFVDSLITREISSILLTRGASSEM